MTGSPSAAGSGGQRRRPTATRGPAAKSRLLADDDEDFLEEPPLWRRALLIIGALALAAVLSAAIMSLGGAIRAKPRGGRPSSQGMAGAPAFGQMEFPQIAEQQVQRAHDAIAARLPGSDGDAYISRRTAGTPAQFLTLVASRNNKAVEAFDNEMSDVVLFDYSSDGSTNCSWCVYVQHFPGVKWELLEAFLYSDWWRDHKGDYKWMWYPDDDLVFQPGDIERLFNLVESQHTFKVVQPSLCKGSQVSHPAMLQTPEDKMPIIHMYSIELQQPLGLVSWWDALHQDGVFDGQTFGFGIDAHWTSYVGNERHVGVVNSICAFHPYRGAGHKSGRDDEGGVVRTVRKYPTFHEIVQSNIKKWKYSNNAEFYYRSRRVHRIGKGNCEKACSKVGICLGIVDSADCDSEEALESPNATIPDTEAYCTASSAPVEGKDRVCCVCVQEDPQWCHAKYQFCNWGKSWGKPKIGVREQEGKVGNEKVESAGRPGRRKRSSGGEEEAWGKRLVRRHGRLFLRRE